MMECKVVLNDKKTGKSYQKVLSEDELSYLFGKKLGDELDLSFLGLDGYKGKISGGSYLTGTPMRKEVDGIGLKKILTGKAIGNREKIRKRKTVAGNTISQFTSQVNIYITEYGSKNLDELFVKNG